MVLVAFFPGCLCFHDLLAAASAICYARQQRKAISDQRSAVSDQRSAISGQRSAVSDQ